MELKACPLVRLPCQLHGIHPQDSAAYGLTTEASRQSVIQHLTPDHLFPLNQELTAFSVREALQSVMLVLDRRQVAPAMCHYTRQHHDRLDTVGPVQALVEGQVAQDPFPRHEGPDRAREPEVRGAQ
jgi:hypothetical protein